MIYLHSPRASMLGKVCIYGIHFSILLNAEGIEGIEISESNDTNRLIFRINILNAEAYNESCQISKMKFS